MVAEDTDNALFTVTLFRRVADTFKTAARTRGFQVFIPSCTCHAKIAYHPLLQHPTLPVLQPHPPNLVAPVCMPVHYHAMNAAVINPLKA